MQTSHGFHVGTGEMDLKRYHDIYCNNRINDDNLYASTERENIEHTRNVMTVSFLREARGRPCAGTTPMHRRSNRADEIPDMDKDIPLSL